MANPLDPHRDSRTFNGCFRLERSKRPQRTVGDRLWCWSASENTGNLGIDPSFDPLVCLVSLPGTLVGTLGVCSHVPPRLVCKPSNNLPE